jgi:hypothetical protein
MSGVHIATQGTLPAKCTTSSVYPQLDYVHIADEIALREECTNA